MDLEVLPRNLFPLTRSSQDLDPSLLTSLGNYRTCDDDEDSDGDNFENDIVHNYKNSANSLLSDYEKNNPFDDNVCKRYNIGRLSSEESPRHTPPHSYMDSSKLSPCSSTLSITESPTNDLAYSNLNSYSFPFSKNEYNSVEPQSLKYQHADISQLCSDVTPSTTNSLPRGTDSYAASIIQPERSLEESFSEYPRSAPPHRHAFLSSLLGYSSMLSQDSSLELDPALTLTPEKRAPSYTKLRYTSGDSPVLSIRLENGGGAISGNSLKESRVRFDPDVAVHQISPNCSSTGLGTSPDASLEVIGSDYSSICGLNSGSWDDEHIIETSGNFLLGVGFPVSSLHDISHCSDSSLETTPNTSLLYSDDFASHLPSGNRDSENFSSNASALSKDDFPTDLDYSASPTASPATGNSPVIVFGSDLRQTADSGVPGARRHTAGKSNTAPSALPLRRSTEKSTVPSRLYRSLPIAGDKGSTSQDRAFIPLKDLVSEVTDNVEVDLTSPREDVASALSKPEMNSTLRVSCGIARLKQSGFDASEALKTKVDQRTKQRIEEKAQLKLNSTEPMFSNLTSLDVRKDELLRRVGEEKLSRVRPDVSERLRHEDLVTRIPDIMDFFTADLQKESVSHTLPGIVVLPVPSQITEPVRAFDVYRHARQWQQL